MTAPLAGLKALEISRVLAGPWAGQLLADLGADVIKVESPDGDDTRQWGPPYIERDGDRTAAYFFSCNRGKRSVTANFKDPGQLRRIKNLALQADVIIENFKTGGLRKYELDFASIAAGNPRIVYCSVTGFGQTGPRSGYPGYDLMIQGMSGVMDITGPEDGPPQKMGVAFADIFSGLYAVVGIQAALSERERTGIGQQIDIALFDCMTGVLANQAMNYLTTGQTPKRKGNLHPNLTPYETYETSDGHIIIATGNNRQFAALCEALDAAGMASDDRYSGSEARLVNRQEMNASLNSHTRRWPKAELVTRLIAAGVPAGPINSVEEAIQDPQSAARGTRIDPEGVPGMRTPIRFSRSHLSLERSAPVLAGEGAEISWLDPN